MPRGMHRASAAEPNTAPAPSRRAVRGAGQKGRRERGHTDTRTGSGFARDATKRRADAAQPASWPWASPWPSASAAVGSSCSRMGYADGAGSWRWWWRWWWRRRWCWCWGRWSPEGSLRGDQEWWAGAWRTGGAERGVEVGSWGAAVGTRGVLVRGERLARKPEGGEGEPHR